MLDGFLQLTLFFWFIGESGEVDNQDKTNKQGKKHKFFALAQTITGYDFTKSTQDKVRLIWTI